MGAQIACHGRRHCDLAGIRRVYHNSECGTKDVGLVLNGCAWPAGWRCTPPRRYSASAHARADCVAGARPRNSARLVTITDAFRGTSTTDVLQSSTYAYRCAPQPPARVVGFRVGRINTEQAVRPSSNPGFASICTANAAASTTPRSAANVVSERAWSLNVSQRPSSGWTIRSRQSTVDGGDIDPTEPRRNPKAITSQSARS